MLLEFRVKNYKTFVDEVNFSMSAAPKQTGLDYSLCKQRLGKQVLKGLCSSVVYGPNASGKTNIIGAMEVLKSIVIRGHIRNEEEGNHPNISKYVLELIPNKDQKNTEPIEFFIDFVENAFRIQYRLVLDIGGFLVQDYERKILLEELSVNENIIFSRSETLEFGNLKAIKNFISKDLIENISGYTYIMQESLDKEELFLTNGFKIMISKEFYDLMYDWFAKKFIIVYRSDSISLLPDVSNDEDKTVLIDKSVNEAAKIFGANSNDIAYIKEDDSRAKMCSIIEDNNKKRAIPVESFESYGTIRFTNIFPFILNAIKRGGTLVIDEFDASIHPIALISIINIFHNDEINVNNAQLIFNTHNPIFLNSNIFRRDEIKFIERDDETNQSILYSLSDFGTAGTKGVRKTDDYMKNYFINRYGAIKDIDFSLLIEELLATREE